MSILTTVKPGLFAEEINCCENFSLPSMQDKQVGVGQFLNILRLCIKVPGTLRRGNDVYHFDLVFPYPFHHLFDKGGSGHYLHPVFLFLPSAAEYSGGYHSE